MTNADLRRLAPRIFFSTQFRVFAVYISLFCTAIAATFIYVYLNLESVLWSEVDLSIERDTQTLSLRFNEEGQKALVSAIEERARLANGALYLLTDASGRRLAGNLETVSAELWDAEGRASFSFRRSAHDTSQRPALGLISRLPSGLRLIVARDISELEAVKQLMRRALLVGYGVTVLIGLAGAVLASRRLLARMDVASNTARAIMQGNLAERIPLSGRSDEFDRLSENLNAMLDRIQDLMTGLKEVSDNIAHDLKTPLHRLRTRAEHALRAEKDPHKLAEALGAVIEEADGLIQVFDALLSIARLEAGSRGESFGPVDITALVGDFVDLYEPAIEDAGLKLACRCPPSVVILGEKHLLGQALANLLDNAIKYAKDGGQAEKGAAKGNRIPLEIGIEDHGATVDLTVADRGPGIPEADRERVLHRFVRLQPSRSIAGSGLGLSLVAAVARLHGGKVTLEDNRPGLRVRLTLAKNLLGASHEAEVHSILKASSNAA